MQFLQGLDINVLPLVQIYADGDRVEAFPCGPRKIELLREKLEKWHFKRMSGREDRMVSNLGKVNATRSVDNRRYRQAKQKTDHKASSFPKMKLVNRMTAAGTIAAQVPLLAQLNEAQLGTVLAESRIAAYEAGDILISEGDIGKFPSVCVSIVMS